MSKLYDQLNNGILDKNATSSSIYKAHLSGINAIDGIYLPSESGLEENERLFATNRELSPWLQIDLITKHIVEGVKIWDRSESSVQGQ